jgi:pimeloyl-ACP methyl ester carboxylesterase
VSIDQPLLKNHRTFRDPRTGFQEEFLEADLGSRRTVAVLSTPLVPAKPMGWVICHSFGMDQIHLGRLEVIAARQLAAAGFPVLRYHGQGYGDSEGPMVDVGLASHLADAAGAVALMASREGLEEVGTMGARFGATVAALTAEAQGLPAMALWDPVTKGSQFMRDFIRSQVFMEMAEGRGDATAVQQIREELETRGVADIKGFPLTRRAHDDISAVDLTTDIRGFRGSALLVGVSRSGRAAPALVKLAEHLGSLGSSVTEEVLQDHRAAQFGQYHYHQVTGKLVKTDTLLDLALGIASVTTSWARRVAGVSAPATDGAS